MCDAPYELVHSVQTLSGRISGFRGMCRWMSRNLYQFPNVSSLRNKDRHKETELIDAEESKEALQQADERRRPIVETGVGEGNHRSLERPPMHRPSAS